MEPDCRGGAVTRDGELIGPLTTADLLRHQAKSPLLLVGRIKTAAGLEALDGYAEQLAATADALFSAGVPPIRIAHVIASLNDTLTGKLVRLAEEALGPPPCPYAWLALGSAGRMEQVLLSDQDNALAYTEDTAAARGYFPALAAQVVGGLLRAGFPECPGGYMATNWCRPIAAWAETFHAWVIEPTPQALVEAEVFLDFRRVAGALRTDELDRILLTGAGRPLFLFHLAQVARQFQAPLGSFGRIRTANGTVDLKRGGSTPIVLLARLYALAARSTARATLDRLAAAADGGVLSHWGAEALSDTYEFLMRLRLAGQLRRWREKREPGNGVLVARLSPLERRRLRDAFRTVRNLQQATVLKFGPNI